MKSLVVTLSSLVLMVSGCSTGGGPQQGSSSYGSVQDEMFAEMLQKKFSITMDSDVAGEMARTACNGPLVGVGYYNAQQAMQKRYPEYSGSVETVMSQGVLAYCPERLP